MVPALRKVAHNGSVQGLRCFLQGGWSYQELLFLWVRQKANLGEHRSDAWLPPQDMKSSHFYPPVPQLQGTEKLLLHQRG